jgi:hypothetical protein
MPELTSIHVDRWLMDYVKAWKSYDRDQIGALFSPDAEYRYHPYDEPLKGRDAIVEDWLRDRDVADTYDGFYGSVAVDGSIAVATGTSTYRTSPWDETVDRIYYNCYVMEFDDDGLCKSFTEWYMKRPDPESPPAET